MNAHTNALPLPGFVGARIDAAARRFLHEAPAHDFSRPLGEPALIHSDSVSWRIFKNPVALFVGGVTAVILELAEPRVRAGVWDHSRFRADPVHRLQRTGMAAMVTVYGARSEARRMIAGVSRRHAGVRGVADDGRPYAADDPELLDWVQATAAYGFSSAYNSWVRPLSRAEFDRVYAEGEAAAALYGATGAPRSVAQMQDLFTRTAPRLEPSPVIGEFLDIMRAAPILPKPLRWAQRMLLRAAVDTLPQDLRARLRLEPRGLSERRRPLVRALGLAADRVRLDSSPAVQACRRLGLPADHLYRGA